MKETALPRQYDSKEELVRHMKGEKSPSPSLPSSPEPAVQPPGVSQSVQINETIGNDFRGLDWQDDDEVQKLIAMDIEADAVIRRTVRPKAKAKPKAILGLMTEGRDENLARDDKILDLMHAREHQMIQDNAEHVARVIEEDILAQRHPPMRECLVFGDPAKGPPAMFRLDADDLPGSKAEWHHMPGSDSSFDSGDSRRSETTHGDCLHRYEWLMPTYQLIATSRDTRYDRPVIFPTKLNCLEIAGYRCHEHILGSHGTAKNDDCNAFCQFNH